jgi:hypothetical protein
MQHPAYLGEGALHVGILVEKVLACLPDALDPCYREPSLGIPVGSNVS